jgi:diguanylate cyclase (GGDEF)-like protein
VSYLNSDQNIMGLIADTLNREEYHQKPYLFFNTAKSSFIFNRAAKQEYGEDPPLRFAYHCEPEPEAEPYWPIVPMIRKLMQANNAHPEQIVTEETCYPSKIPVIRCILEGTPLGDVFQEPFIDEADYEKDQITESLVNILLKTLKGRHCVGFFKDFHFASPSTFRLISALVSRPEATKIRLIGTLNRSHHFTEFSRNQAFERSVKALEERAHIYEAHIGQGDEKPQIRWERQPSLASMTPEKFVDLLQKQFQMASFPEITETVDWAFAKLEDLAWEKDPKFRYQLLKYQAIGGYYLGEIDGPLQHLRSLLALAEQEKDTAGIAESYGRTTLVHLRNNNIAEAERMVQQSIKFAERTKQDSMICFSYLMQFMVCDVQATTLPVKVFERLIAFCEKHQYLRTLIYIHKDAFFYTDYYKDYEAILAVIDRSISIAQDLKNEHALAMLYHKKGIIYSIQGHFDLTIDFFTQSEKIRRRLGDPLEIIRICNGIGFYYLLLESYSEALKYFQRAADSLYQVKNFSEICLTLLNLALVYLLTKNYGTSLELINKTLEIMQLLRIEYLPFRSLADVYMIKAYCLLRTGETAKAVDFIRRALRSKLPLTEESQIFQFMSSGYLKLREGEIQGAVEEYQTALGQVNHNIKSQEILLPFLYSECAGMLIAHNWKGEAKSFTQSGLEKSQEMNYPLHQAWLEEVMENPQQKKLLELPFPSIHIQTLEELAKKEVTVNLLNNKINNIEFLQRLQQLFAKDFTENGISLEFLHLIQIYFPAEAGFIFQQNSEGWKVVAEMNGPKAPSPSVDSLIQISQSRPSLYFPEKGSGRTSPRMYQFAQACSSLISLPMKKQDGYQYLIILVTLKDDAKLTLGDLDVLTIAANQVQFMYDRIAYEEALKRLASTDSLTKLANRKSLQSKLEEEVSRLRRYGNLYQNSLSLMFIDLDNFKYYNDQFGHAAGDLILKEFAQLLCKHLRNIDFVSRYGGDEFVLVMPETDRAGAVIVGERILSSMQAADGFIQELKSLQGESQAIPQDKKLTCSIGLVSLSYFQIEAQGNKSSTEELIETLMRSADDGLYASKNKGKNQLTSVEPDLQSLGT